MAFLLQSQKIWGKVLRNFILKQTDFHLWQLNHFTTYFASELIAFAWHADNPVLLFTRKSFAQNLKKVFCYLLLCYLTINWTVFCLHSPQIQIMLHTWHWCYQSGYIVTQEKLTMFQSQVLNHLQNTLQPFAEIDEKGQESGTKNPGTSIVPLEMMMLGENMEDEQDWEYYFSSPRCCKQAKQ